MKRVLLLSFFALATLASAVPARLPGPAGPAYERGARASKNAGCVSCHGGVARDHEASLHAVSFSDPSFQKGYAKEPEAFCRSCHAPESKPDVEPDAFARGMACVTCHVPEGTSSVLASENGRTSSAPQVAPHPVTRVAGFGTSACTKCHEFSFPHSEPLGKRGLMQKTMSEHASSSDAGKSCASCHMPSGAHQFAASRDAKMLERALDARASRHGDAITITLRARGVGHAFPTGDLFRRLLLRVHTPRGDVERPYGRSFGAERNEAGDAMRFETSDMRLQPEQRFEFAAKGPVRWEVLYQRVTFITQSPPIVATVEDEKVLARGLVP